MPLHKRGKEQPENDRPAKKRKKEYDVLDNIGYQMDHHHSLFRALPDHIDAAITFIGRYIVSFLNSEGGILAFGVRSSGIIYGDKISRREEDILKCTIDEAVKKINPCVCYNMYSVSFTPVKGNHFGERSDVSRQVLEIRVGQGEPYELYEDQKHEAFTRDGLKLVGPLTPHQIKDITIVKLKQRIRSEKKLADFLSPARPSAVKMSIKGEGHREVAARAVSLKGKRSDRDKNLASTSSLAMVTRGSKGKTSSSSSSQTGEETVCKEKGGKAKCTRETRSSKDSAASQTSKSVPSAAKDSASSSKNSTSDKSGSEIAKDKSSALSAAVKNASSSVKGTKDSTRPQSSNSSKAMKGSDSSKNSSSVTKGTKDSAGERNPTSAAKESEVSTDCPAKLVPVNENKGSVCNKENSGRKTSKEEMKELPLVVDKENQKSLKPLKDVPATETRKALSTASNSSRSGSDSKVQSTTGSTSNSSRSGSDSKVRSTTGSTSNSSHSGRPVAYPTYHQCVRKRVIKLPPPPPPPSFSRPTYYCNQPPSTLPLSNYRIPESHLIQRVPTPQGIYWDQYYQCYRRQ